MKPGELITLRAQNAEMRKLIPELRTIAANTLLQANELKAWILVLLKQVGPQRVKLDDWHAVGEGGKGTVFAVTPCEDDPSYVMLSVGDVEKPPAPSTAEA